MATTKKTLLLRIILFVLVGLVVILLFNYFTKGNFLSSSRANKVANVTDYKQQYRNAMKQVNMHYRTMTDEDWLKLDHLVYNYSIKQYAVYEDQLSFAEKLEFAEYPIQYYLSKYKSIVNEHIKTDYKADMEALVGSLNAITDSTYSVFYNETDLQLRRMLDIYGGNE